MPRRPQWYQRVPRALIALADFPAPVVDRGKLESLLGVGRRDAIRLMHRLGGYRCGQMLLVDKEDLRQSLEAIAQGQDWQWESRRRERVGERLTKMRLEWAARNISIPAARFEESVDGLPPTVRLAPGRLEVSFDGAVDLLSQLLHLTQAISNDYAHFESLLE